MGIVFGRFRRKKSTYDLLEKLDGQIKEIEEYGRNTETKHRKIVGRFMLVSVFVYVITASIFYFYFFPASVYDRLFYIIPLISAPVLIFSVKRILTWWYNRQIRKNQGKLSTLKEEKQKILDKVMETETYKVAKKILDKFAPEMIQPKKSITNVPPAESTPARPMTVQRFQTTGLRYRGTPAGPFPSRSSIPGASQTPPQTALRALPPASTATRSLVPRQSLPGTPLPLPRTVLPRERSVFDKMVDYLVGDGPSNRYALICSYCSSHNGMALREEFEYISFRCCYCYAFNPARKKRPSAPKLQFEQRPSKKFSDTSDSEKNSESDGSEPEVESRNDSNKFDLPDASTKEENVDGEAPTEREIEDKADKIEIEEIKDVEVKTVGGGDGAIEDAVEGQPEDAKHSKTED